MLCPSTQQAPMDTADWLKAIVQDNEASATMMMDSSSSHSPSPAEFVRHSQPPPPPPPPPPPMLERRLRPPHDQPLKCPRCDSTHTKFCYYNNYSLSQPRYFCKTCRRYWTKGGSLRNVPVGGGCRKNKRSSGSAKKAAEHHHHPVPLGQFPPPGAYGLQDGSTDLHLSTLAGLLPPISHLNDPGGEAQRGFTDCNKYAFNVGPVEAKLGGGGVFTNPRGQFLLQGLDGGNGGDDHGTLGGFGEMGHGFGGGVPTAFGGGAAMYSPLAFSMDLGTHGATAAENCQRLALPWNGNVDEDAIGVVESKPDPKMLSLEWQEQCGELAREPFGYSTAAAGGSTGLISWGAVASSHHVGSSAAPNPLV